jgi:phytoene dehydrogenase-like protein
MKTDLVVVGGGLGGLAAATLAARGGLKVVVLERSGHLGGRATTRTMGGALFNQGPHALYRGGPAIRALRAIGVPFKGRSPSSLALWAACDGEVQPLTAGTFSLAGSPVLTVGEKVELFRAVLAIQTVDTSSLQATTLDDWLAAARLSPRVLEVVQALTRVTTYTNAGDVVSAGAVLHQLRTALRNGVLYLDGGWQTLVEGLRTAAIAAGVELVTDARVEKIEADASGVRGVQLADGRTMEASRVILAVSPSVAASLAGGETLTRLAEEAIPAHAACLDLSLRRLPNARRFVAQGLEAPTYFSVHSRYAKLGPNGEQVIHVAKYLRPGDSGLDARRELEALTDLMQPGWRDELSEAKFLPRMVVLQAIPRADRGGMSGRAPVGVDDRPGVFLVGDSVGDQGMLTDAVFASAERAAREAVAFRSGTNQDARPRVKGQMVA